VEIYSKIDSDRFGIKIGKTTESFFYDKNIEEGVNYFIKNNFELIIIRIDFSFLNLINGLEKYGFTIKDTQTTLYYMLKDEQSKNLFDISKICRRNDCYKIREFKPSDTEMIVNLSKSCFNNYGHYSMNKRLNSKDCNDVYVDWAYNSCINENVANKIFVAEKNDEVVGYIAYKINHQENKKYVAGVIGAISSEHRGNGLFYDIDVAALEWGTTNDFDWEENNVLSNNYAVLKSHIKAGFKPNKFIVTLHGWMDEIKI